MVSNIFPVPFWHCNNVMQVWNKGQSEALRAPAQKYRMQAISLQATHLMLIQYQMSPEVP